MFYVGWSGWWFEIIHHLKNWVIHVWSNYSFQYQVSDLKMLYRSKFWVLHINNKFAIHLLFLWRCPIETTWTWHWTYQDQISATLCLKLIKIDVLQGCESSLFLTFFFYQDFHFFCPIFSLILPFLPNFTLFFLVSCLWPLIPLVLAIRIVTILWRNLSFNFANSINQSVN